jgi:DNA-binding winged helix-turn-helix (wHTH) protein
MATPSRTSQRVRFGEFELDLSTRELWTNSSKQTLAPQPFQVLELLIEHRGDLVTRDMLVKRLWPSDTFVDYEQGLKKAIARLRENLGDSAEEPRFIENLPRQGYRFIAEVRENHIAHINEGKIAVLRPTAVEFSASDVPTARAPGLRVPRTKLAMALVTVGVLAAIAFIWLRSRETLLTVAESKALTNDGVAKRSLVTDGARLYYAEMVDGTFGISQISLSGGEKLWTRMPFVDPYIYDVSPDRSKLLVGGNSTRQLWVMPLPAGEPHIWWATSQLSEHVGLQTAVTSFTRKITTCIGQIRMAVNYAGSLRSQVMLDFRTYRRRVTASASTPSIRTMEKALSGKCCLTVKICVNYGLRTRG